MVCSQSSVFQCGNPCGNPLSCGNHTCQSACHFVTIPRRIVGFEILEHTVHKPLGVDLSNPADAIAEGAWGHYESAGVHGIGSTLDKQNRGAKEERPLSEDGDAKIVDMCEKCTLPCQKVRSFWCLNLMMPLIALKVSIKKCFQWLVLKRFKGVYTILKADADFVLLSRFLFNMLLTFFRHSNQSLENFV